MPAKFDNRIVCAYLYTITKYGYPPPANQTFRYLEQMSALGFTAVELEGIREDHIREMFSQRDAIKKKLDDLALQIPVYCTVLPHLSSTDKAKVEHQLDLFTLGCQTAKVLGATYILDNGPLPPYLFPTEIPITRHYEHDLLSQAAIHPEFNWSSFWHNLIHTFQRVCDIASQYGLTYLIHPAFGVLAATPEAYLNFAQSVNRKNLGYNLDTSNLIALKCNLSLAIKQLGSQIKYIHVSDNRGIRNEHLAPGKGIINWLQFFQDLKEIDYQGPIGIDIGGDESEIDDLDLAYKNTASFIDKHWKNQSNLNQE